MAPARPRWWSAAATLALKSLQSAWRWGLEVHVLEMEQRVLQRVTTPAMSAFYRDLHEGPGGANPHFRPGYGLPWRQPSNRRAVRRALLSGGLGRGRHRHPAGHRAGRGGRCWTAMTAFWSMNAAARRDPNIYAAGDCTNHPNPLLGRRLRLESRAERHGAGSGGGGQLVRQETGTTPRCPGSGPTNTN